MKCCEEVMVTLRFAPQGRCLEMELPAFLPVGELEKKLIETLITMDPARYGGTQEVVLQTEGKRLEDETTLAQAGVWDGSVLDVTLRREG